MPYISQCKQTVLRHFYHDMLYLSLNMHSILVLFLNNCIFEFNGGKLEL